MAHCLNCNKKLTPRNTKYCSNFCQADLVSKTVIKRWLDGGTAVKGVTLQIKKAVRAFLLQESDFKCTDCGWGEKHPSDGRSTLQVHHIDGDASNSRRENLKVLCPNCHSITASYGSRNPTSARKRYL